MKYKSIKKILAIIFLFAMIFENLMPLYAVSSSGSGNWVVGQFDSYIYNSDDLSLGVLLRRMYNMDTGEMITAFCSQHNVESPNGIIENANHSAPTDPTLKYACKIAYFGWYSKYGSLVVDGDIPYSQKLDYVFTQQYIWEYLGQSSGHFINGDIQNQYIAFRNTVYNQINSMAMQPSFTNQTINMNLGETKVLTDTNNVLKDYATATFTADGITVSHTEGENTLSVTVASNCTLDEYELTDYIFSSIGMLKNGTINYDTTIYFSFRNGVQDQLYSMHYNDPVSLNLGLQINQLGSLELTKLDTNGQLIDGSTFTVIGENFEQDVVVSGGKIRVDNLKPGTYTIYEKTAPYGYVKDTNTYSANVTSNNVTTQAITNIEVTGEFRLNKKGINNTNLAGVSYKFWNNNGYDVTKTTDSNGSIVLNNLKLGTYYYQEINTIDSYLIDNTVYSFEIKYKDQNTPVVYESATRINDVPKGVFELFKKNETQDINLSGIEYEFWNDTGFYIDKVTDENGKIRLENLELGKYYYKEKSTITGYILDNTTYSFEITYKDQYTSIIYESATKTNKEAKGKITLYKWNKDKSSTISNVGIRIWNSEYGFDNTFFTDSTGKIEVDNLKLGTYNYQEISTVEGYLLNNNIYTIELKYKDQYTPVIYVSADIINDEPTGEIRLEKTDIDTGNQNRIDGTSHHGDAMLNNTTYTLYAGEDIYNKARTIKYFSKDEEIGKYVFNDYGNAVATITNTNTTAEIFAENDTIKGLPMGRFYAKETYISEGYQLDTEKHIYNLNYKDDKTETISIYDKLKNKVDKAKFEVIKISSNENKTAKTIAGARFCAILTKYVEYYGSFEEAMKHLSEYAEDEYSIFTTNENGHGISSYLAYGNYTVNEIEVPNENLNKVETFYVDINKNSTGVIKEFIENDTEFDSYLKIRKVDKDTGKSITLTNATFTLSILNDENEWEKVTTKTGKQTYDSWTTDETGTAYTETKLKVGTYKADEIKVPTGFLKLSEAIIFTINNKNETLEYDKDFDAYITITAENEQPKGSIEVIKTIDLRENIDTSLIDIDYTKIRFKLSAKENIIDFADGEVIYEKGKEILTFNLNENGTYKIDNLPLGLYELQELKTLDGVILNSAKYEIKIQQEDLVTKYYNITKEISNNTTIFEFSKTDVTGDNEIVGAEMQLLDENNNVIDSWKSNKDSHKIEGLIVGNNYTLIEKIAPNGYVKASEIKFKVLNIKEIQKVIMKDKVVTISKEDIAGKEIEGATLQVLDLDKNIIDEWISTDTPHSVNGLEEGKKYILHEEITAEGYVKATDIEFTVDYEKENQHITMIDKMVYISKVDITNSEEIEGAELFVTDEEDNIIDRWFSTNEKHIVYGLEEGKTYKLTEKTAPYGYEIAETIKFNVTTDKEDQIIVMKDKHILNSIRLVKKDKDTKEIIKTDCVFGLFKDENCEDIIQKYISNNGVIEFKDLIYGIYYIKELVPPNKYSLSDEVIKVEINDKGIFINDTQMDSLENIYSFEFYNVERKNPDTRNN